MENLHPADRIIVALDGMAPEQALRFAAPGPLSRWTGPRAG